MRKLVFSFLGAAVVLSGAVVRVQAAPATCAVRSLVEHCESWSDVYGTPQDVQNAAVSVAITPDGSRVLRAGYTAAAPNPQGPVNGRDFVVAANDAGNGTRRWSATYDGPSAGDDQAVALTISPDGTKAFVTGESQHSPGNYDYATVAYDVATGSRLWVARYDGPASRGDVPTGIATDGNRVYVTGYSSLGIHPTAGVDIYAATTIAYDVTTGAQQWLARYQGQAGLWDIPQGLAAAGGRVYITARSNGASTSNDDTDDATVAYDATTGSQLWASRFDSGTRDYPHGLAATTDGSRVYVTAERIWNGFGASDYVTLGYDGVSGARAWSAVYATPGGGNEIPISVAVSPAGDRVFVTGFGSDDITPVDRSAVTIAYSSSGQQLWLSRHTTPGGEAMGKVAVSPDGQRAYVTGLAIGQSFGVGFGYIDVQAPATLAYDTGSGAVVWSAHFLDQGQGRDAVVSPDSSRVYVAVGGSDAATVAYDR